MDIFSELLKRQLEIFIAFRDRFHEQKKKYAGKTKRKPSFEIFATLSILRIFFKTSHLRQHLFEPVIFERGMKNRFFDRANVKTTLRSWLSPNTITNECSWPDATRSFAKARNSSTNIPSSEPKRSEGEVPRSIRLAIRGVVGTRLWSPSASDCPLLG